MSVPRPVLVPSVPPPVPGREACGCGAGNPSTTPAPLFNRGGLSEIAYRIGDYSTFRASLHAALLAPPSAPARGAATARAVLGTRDPSDFTIALADAFACAADVLTFYQERIANESYLGTAVERRSLQELGKLVGYRLRPGVAAETWLAFALDVPPEPPAWLATEPGRFVAGVPRRVALEPGLSVQSVPGPGEEPQTFETVEGLSEARPEWNGLRPPLRERRLPRAGDESAHLTGVGNDLKVGDGLLFVGDEFHGGRTSEVWDFRVLEEVRLETDLTFVRWGRKLGDERSAATDFERQVYALRRKTRVLPPRSQGPEGPVSLQQGISRGTIDLDGVHADIAVGSYVVLARGAYRRASAGLRDARVELFVVVGVNEVTVDVTKDVDRTVTQLELEGESLGAFVRASSDRVDVVSVFAVSEKLTCDEQPATAAVEGACIPVAANVDGLHPGRRLIVRGTTEAGETVVVRAELVTVDKRAGSTELVIKPPLPKALKRESVVVHANVVLASHGESVAELLGEGDASALFQRFELRALPLTYRAAANERGAASELVVRVSDIAWTERDTLYGAAPADRAYALDQDEQGRWFVVFGDGVHGARLPTGPSNVRASYRRGLGVAGNVGAETLTQLGSHPLGVSSVSNPLAAEGGTDPESAAMARRTIPFGTRTLGRVVSVLDYEDFARAFGGIAKAQAAVLHIAGAPTVVVTLAGAAGAVLTPDSPVWLNLLAALRQAGDPQVALRLLSYQPRHFRLRLGIKREPAHERGALQRAIEARLRAQYGFDQRDLGQPVQRSEVISVVQNTPGVVAVDVRGFERVEPEPPSRSNLTTKSTAPSPTVFRLLAARTAVVREEVENEKFGTEKVQAAELLTLDPAPLDFEEMP